MGKRDPDQADRGSRAVRSQLVCYRSPVLFLDTLLYFSLFYFKNLEIKIDGEQIALASRSVLKGVVVGKQLWGCQRLLEWPQLPQGPLASCWGDTGVACRTSMGVPPWKHGNKGNHRLVERHLGPAWCEEPDRICPNLSLKQPARQGSQSHFTGEATPANDKCRNSNHSSPCVILPGF